MKEKYLVNRKCLLVKWEGKGAWTYTPIPEIKQDKNAPFGWVTVSGFIDDYRLEKHKLMPMGDGKLFLSVNATIRKKIRKESGDHVLVKLNVDAPPNELTEELCLCFDMEPPATLKAFEALKEKERRKFLDRIHSSKSEEKKAERIADMMKELAKR
ncbi:hypothetical protein FUAX_47700 (plasmid) [Fulvitalea axinellae]|uniref:DUF1905 domain-containing protein n=1 Tax=Fulvitalea axinellae TaxID=1182444 RepID=A0AAU9D8N2_9BACT|nr:hypothetical protein FUAX_47700 [Fulvitalea axinellae]